jgi:tetratricopeptide (TPR) repeat protein
MNRSRGNLPVVARLAACALLLAASRAEGDPARDAPGADELFDRGKALLAGGKWDEACQAFQASMDLDPSVSTLIKLARCHEHAGRLTLALHDYNEALAMNSGRQDETDARRSALRALAHEERARVAARLPRLKIVVGDRPPGLRVLRGGQEMPLSALGEPLPMDAGRIAIVAEAPGRVPARSEVLLQEGETSVVSLTLAPMASATVPVTPAPASGPGGRVVAGWVTGGAGVATLGVSAVFGIETLAKVHASNAYCNALDQCSAQGLSLRDAARGDQAAGFVLLGVGAVLVGAGLLLAVGGGRAARSAAAAWIRASPAYGRGAF